VNNDTLAKTLAQELSYAESNSHVDFSEMMQTVREYFDGIRPGQIDKDMDESFEQVVSEDIANAVEHTLADIMPAFSSERLVVFKPDGPDDVQRADEETLLVNSIILEQSDGLISFTEAVKDALMYKRGIMEVRVEESYVPSYADIYNMLPEEAIASGLDVVKVRDDGSIQVRKYDKIKTLALESVPVDEFKVNADLQSIDLDKARLVARDYRVNASDIVQLGYSKEFVDTLPDFSDTPTQSPDKNFSSYETADDSTRAIRLVRAYYRIDADDDGIAELRYILAAGNDHSLTILENDPVEEQAFVLGVPLIDPHRSSGISLAEKLKMVQTIKTKLLRQILTANERAIRGRVGIVTGLVNEDDYLDSVFGGTVRLRSKDGIVPLPSDPFPQQAYAALEYQDKIRRESGGSAIDKASQENLPVTNEASAHGVERIMTAMEQLNSYIASNVLKTLVQKTFCKVHSVLRRYWDEEIVTESGDKWVVGVPTTWPRRTKVSTTVGLTLGERSKYVGLLTQYIAEASQMQKEGSLLVTDDTIYGFMQQRAVYTAIPGISSLYIDPQSEKYAIMSQQRQQIQQQQQMMQMQQAQQQNQLLIGLEEVRAQGRIQAQQIKAQSDQMISGQEMASSLEEKLRELTLEYDKLMVKMVELNAQYDKEDVPDVFPGTEADTSTVQ